MGYLGYKPADKPLTAADITDSIITSAKITDATIVNGDIANSTIALAKLSATGTASASTFLRGDNSWNTPAAGAFVYLGATGSQSNVASVDLNGYFTSDYNIYKIFIDEMYKSGSSDGEWLRIRANTGSYTTQTSSYKNALARVRGNLQDIQFDVSSAYWQFALLSTNSNYKSSAEVTIYDPLQTTAYHTMTAFAMHWNGAGNQNMSVLGGAWESTTAITGLNFSASADNIYVTNIRIYGVKNS
jgi:hypothetical protein